MIDNITRIGLFVFSFIELSIIAIILLIAVIGTCVIAPIYIWDNRTENKIENAKLFFPIISCLTVPPFLIYGYWDKIKNFVLCLFGY